MTRAIVVLAAGLSARMGGPNKLLHPYRGQPLAAWAIQCAAKVAADRHVIVLGRDSEVISALAPETFLRVVNPTPEQGMASSLRLGLAAAGRGTRCAILLADMPEITPELVDSLFAASAGRFAALPRRGQDWGNPVVLGETAVKAAMALAGDAGARALLKAHAHDLAFVETDSGAIFRDLDRPDDFTG